MKIRCDVCDKAEASVFCSADEAALCRGCDLQVHRANKLAGKHSRFSLLPPIKTDSPLCDICQERRALVFCQQDRAILCRECDISIHEANEHTQKHSRFLLTGVKLSSTCFSYQTSSSSNGCDAAMDVKTGSSHACSKRPKMVANEISSSHSTEKVAPSTNHKAEDGQASDGGSFSTSSISEYLETLPGWCVEEFLDPSVAANRFCKFNGRIQSIGNQNLESRHESLGSTRFGNNTLEFLGKISVTRSWNGVGISTKTCGGEKIAIAEQIIISFSSGNTSGKIEKQTETNFLFVFCFEYFTSPFVLAFPWLNITGYDENGIKTTLLVCFDLATQELTPPCHVLSKILQSYSSMQDFLPLSLHLYLLIYLNNDFSFHISHLIKSEKTLCFLHVLILGARSKF